MRAGRVLTQAAQTKRGFDTVLTQLGLETGEDDGRETIKPFRISKDLVGAGRFERPTPCAQGMGVLSKGSIVYVWLPIFPTTWGTCFSLRHNPSRVNESSFGTVLSQLGLTVSINLRLHEDRHVGKQITTQLHHSSFDRLGADTGRAFTPSPIPRFGDLQAATSPHRRD